MDYPSLEVEIERARAGQLGVTVDQVGRALVAGTSSSRFTTPNYWADPRTGVAYQVQVEIPQSQMASGEDVQNLPVMPGGVSTWPLVRDVVRVGYGATVGEYDRYNIQRMVTLTANVVGEDLGRTAAGVDAALQRAGSPPRGVTVNVRGQVAPMQQTLAGLRLGLLLAVLAIFLLLAANFQSLRLAFVVLSTIPAAVAGVLIALLVTGTTLNMQSFMGTIMAIGVAVANSILLVTFAEDARRAGADSMEAALRGASARIRPILMTTLAMIAGMIPMALALGEGAKQSAPLGRAVIGGLGASAIAALTVLPSVFSIVQGHAGTASVSLDPDDPGARHLQARFNEPKSPGGEIS